jgi:hypothetical protein
MLQLAPSVVPIIDFRYKKNVSIGHGHSNLTCAFWSQTLWNKFQMICISRTSAIEQKPEKSVLFTNLGA